MIYENMSIYIYIVHRRIVGMNSHQNSELLLLLPYILEQKYIFYMRIDRDLQNIGSSMRINIYIVYYYYGNGNIGNIIQRIQGL